MKFEAFQFLEGYFISMRHHNNDSHLATANGLFFSVLEIFCQRDTYLTWGKSVVDLNPEKNKSYVKRDVLSLIQLF